MGREIRRVALNWRHPKQVCPHSPWAGGCNEAKQNGGICSVPLYDESYREAVRKWKEGYAQWEAKTHPDYDKGCEYWDWEGVPPDPEMYRPDWTDEERVWYQVYETVSEGTPVTPAFATKEELVDHLVAHGDMWDQFDGKGGWSRENAESFVGRGFAVSFVVRQTVEQREVLAPRDGQFKPQHETGG